MTTVRRATRDDIPQCATTLARAFTGYPWTTWAIPAEDHQRRVETLFTLNLTNIGLAHDEVWMTDDAASVALWIPPKEQQTVEVDWERHETATAPIFGAHLERLEAGEALVVPLLPKDPSWYLAILGTRPGHQGQGLGTRVLAPVLARCDAEDLPAMTDTVTPENVAFYRRLGFEVLHEMDLPMDGPPLWILWREAR